jgi:iron(III) transport system permease protein
MSRPRIGQWQGILLAALLTWLVLWPLVIVAGDAVREPSGGVSLDGLREFLAQGREGGALWNSLWISLASVLFAGLIGVPLAFLFSWIEFPGRRWLAQLVALPVVLPPLVGVLAFLFLCGESGFAARLVQLLSGRTDPPWRFQGAGAILLVHTYSMYVYFYLFVRAGLRGIDRSVYEAAESLGAGRLRILWRVVLPLLRPALAGATLLVFLTSLASFSAPYLFGGGFRVMTTQIVSTRLNGDDRLAMVETLALTAVALVALTLVRRVDAEGQVGGSKGTPPAARPVRRRSTRLGLAAAAWLLTLVLLLPHATLLLVSLVPLGSWTVEALPPAYTLGNYGTLVTDPVRFRPLATSLWMALVATSAAVLLGLWTARLVVRRRVAARGYLEFLVALPWAVPGTVFAIALATAFSVNQPLALRIILVGTPLILPLAYLIRNLPLAGRALIAGYRRLEPAYEEAAQSLGAGPVRTMARVVLPLLGPSLMAGATLAFVAAFGDFVTSILLYTYDTRPISLEILGSLRQGDLGVAAAYGVVLMAVSGVVFLLTAERERRA